MPVPQHIVQASQALIRDQRTLKEFQREYERMARLDWTLPSPLDRYDWIKAFITTSPYDALRGARAALSNLLPHFKIHPTSVLKALDDDVQDTDLAALEMSNQWETVLKWQLKRMGKRTGKIENDVVWSASLYDEVIGHMIYLPTQFKLAGKTMSKARKAAAFRFGDWAVRRVDPKTVWVRYSDYGLEAVLHINVRSHRWMNEFYGDKAKVLNADVGNKVDPDDTYWVECDYVDHDNGRIVFAYSGKVVSADSISDQNHVLEELGPWLKIPESVDKDDPLETGAQVPFLPWVAAAGGTSVDTQPEFQRQPILYSVLLAGKFAGANIMGTIAMSKAISTGAAPEHVISGPGAKDIKIDYTTPGGRIDLPNQFLDYQAVQSAGLDPQMMQALDTLNGEIAKTTVAEVLVTAQPISGEQAFASYNLQVQQALASLGNVREVSERWFDMLTENMLLVTHFTGGAMTGYGTGSSEKYEIKGKDINPEALIIDTELKSDVAADRLQRVNAAMQMVQVLNYSPQRALESLGETDPESILKEWMVWQIRLADFEGRLERLRMERSGEIQQIAQEIAGQMAEEQAAAQPAPTDPSQAEAMAQAPGFGGLSATEGNPFAQSAPSEGLTAGVV